MAKKMKKNKIKRIVKMVKASRKRSGKNQNHEEKNQDLKYPQGKYIEAVGRRKVATARVRIYESDGDFIVNDQLVGQYFASVLNAPQKYNQPFNITKTKDKLSVTAIVKGSGIHAQLDALAHGLSRALIKYDPELRAFLKPAGLLTRDDRMKETRKPGRGGKARSKRQSPKR